MFRIKVPRFNNNLLGFNWYDGDDVRWVYWAGDSGLLILVLGRLSLNIICKVIDFDFLYIFLNTDSMFSIDSDGLWHSVLVYMAKILTTDYSFLINLVRKQNKTFFNY